MPGPIQKRLMPVNIDSFDRKHHNVMDLMAGVMGSSSRASKAVFLQDMHTEQFLICLTYKLMWTNVLPAVDMTVAKLVWHASIKKLQAEGVSTVMAPRAFTRMKCIASVLTVMHALENVFHMPGGEYFGKPFDLGMMHAVGPYLVATEEIAIYVLTLMSSAWMNEAEPDCVKALAQLKCKLPSKESNLWDGFDTSNFSIKFKVLNEQLDDSDPEKYDFNRLALKGSLDSIAEEVSVYDWFLPTRVSLTPTPARSSPSAQARASCPRRTSRRCSRACAGGRSRFRSARGRAPQTSTTPRERSRCRFSRRTGR